MPKRTTRRPVTPPAPYTKKRGTLLPLIAAVGIGLMVIGLIAALLPDSMGGQSSNSAAPPAVNMTPGAQESTMRARLQQNPNDVDAMVVLADLLANSGRVDEAITYYDQAAKARPDDEQLRIAFGTVLLHAGYNADAETQLLKAKELVPSDPQPYYLLGQLYEAWQPERTDDAVAMYKAAVAAAPDSVYAQRAQDRLSALTQA